MDRSIKLATAREKQLKGGSRRKELDLINGFDPDWLDLVDEIQMQGSLRGAAAGGGEAISRLARRLLRSAP